MEAAAPSIRELALRLYDVGAVKFGEFTLKSGVVSPVYFDLRVIVSYPKLLSEVSAILWSLIKDYASSFQSVCGVPYTALPIATVMSVNNNVPMLVRRKEAKDYGTKRMVEGRVVAGSQCLVVEDVITTGTSVLETRRVLQDAGVGVSHVVVLLDREGGGHDNIEKEGITCVCAMTLSQLMGYLLAAGKVSSEVGVAVEQFMLEQRNGGTKTVVSNGVDHHTPVSLATPLSSPCSRVTLSYSARSKMCVNPLAARLLALMDKKKTNLAVSADFTSSAQLTKLADLVGPYVCMLKTHVDMVTDFSAQVAEELHMLAQQHDFIIMEDRKFCDIGNTVRCQYQNKEYHLTSGWAELVTCHTVSGPGIITALKGVASEGSGCVLVAEMSSEGALASGSYTQSSVAMATTHQDFVAGIVCRSHLSSAPGVVHMTPGVKLQVGSDGLGQQYISPEEAVGRRYSDIIIVGRGITQEQDWVAAAREHRDAAYGAYLGRLAQ